EKNRHLAEENFKKAGVTQKMEFRVGDALELLAKEKGPYDLIFNDVDKEFYPDVIEPVYRLLRKGGLFITDNALWHGRVSRPAQYPEKATAAVLEFNARLKVHTGFLTSILPLRDGISISIRG
ncbi:MAG: O-methyltransferase, partial [bacterium]|nr:O-methyltransferase [bacterium]